MSYGRDPQYIYECACGGNCTDTPSGAPHPKERHVVFLCYPITWDELAQFMATAHWRGELDGLVARGYELRPELAAGRTGKEVSAFLSRPSQNPSGAAAAKPAKTAGRGGRR